MADYSFLSRYVLVNENDPTGANFIHKFYPLKHLLALRAESRLKFLFPTELMDFYSIVGYGFMHVKNEQSAINRFLDPSTVADIYLRAGFYANDPDLDIYDDADQLIFFEVNEGVYLSLDLAVKGDKSPVYYIDSKVSDSLEQFLREFNEDPNYLGQFEEE